MTNRFFCGLVTFVATAALALSQAPKSPDEVKALQAILGAQTPDERIAAVEALVAKFKDTEFKDWAYSAAAEAAQSKRDDPKAIFYYEAAIKANPKNHNAYLMEASLLAQTTREFDLDKDEKLAKAEKYVKTGLDLIPTAIKTNPQIPDDQWAAMMKDDAAQGHVALGMVASVRKKYDVAATEYKAAIDTAANPDAVTMIRLAAALTDSGKPDDAIATLDKALATPNLPAQAKTIAEAEKTRAAKVKAAAAPKQ